MSCLVVSPGRRPPGITNERFQRTAVQQAARGASADIFERLQPNLELVPLKLGASVYEAGGKQPYVYFPTTPSFPCCMS